MFKTQQQQQRRNFDRQQQQSGSGEFQSHGQQQQGDITDKKQMGEGSYSGTADYNKRTAEYLKKNDVKADAEAAKPKNEKEAADMQKAEEEGKSHSKAKGK